MARGIPRIHQTGGKLNRQYQVKIGNCILSRHDNERNAQLALQTALLEHDLGLAASRKSVDAALAKEGV